jgi:anti-anti-sigma factor
MSSTFLNPIETAFGPLTELVRGQEQLLLERVGPLVERQDVMLDLGAVERIDAAGISALITLYASALEAGHRFAISNPSPRVAQILSLVGLNGILLSHNVSVNSQCGGLCEQSAA